MFLPLRVVTESPHLAHAPYLFFQYGLLYSSWPIKIEKFHYFIYRVCFKIESKFNRRCTLENYQFKFEPDIVAHSTHFIAWLTILTILPLKPMLNQQEGGY